MTKPVPVTDSQVLERLKVHQGAMSQIQFANHLGVTPSYLSDVYHGRKLPNGKILKFLGIRKTDKDEIVKYEADV